MLSLGVYAIGSRLRHIVRREICSPAIRSSKGVWRCLQVDGHEHITSCLFLLLMINIPLEGRIGGFKMNLIDSAIQQTKLNKEKYSKPHEKYVDTTYIAIQEDNHVVCSIDPIVLENAKLCILVHRRSKLAETNYYDWFVVEYINENGEVYEESIDKEYRLYIRHRETYRNQILHLVSSDGIDYECCPFWNNTASIKDCFQSMWNLYNELKKASCTKERAIIVRLYEQDEKILQQKKEIANFSYANALLEKERDMYKGLLDEIKILLTK